jgi:hypothetical protein
MHINSQVFTVDVVPVVVVFGIFTLWNAVLDVSRQHQFHWIFRYVLSKSRNKQTLHDAEPQKTAIGVHMV